MLFLNEHVSPHPTLQARKCWWCYFPYMRVVMILRRTRQTARIESCRHTAVYGNLDEAVSSYTSMNMNFAPEKLRQFIELFPKTPIFQWQLKNMCICKLWCLAFYCEPQMSTPVLLSMYAVYIRFSHWGSYLVPVQVDKER